MGGLGRVVALFHTSIPFAITVAAVLMARSGICIVFYQSGWSLPQVSTIIRAIVIIIMIHPKHHTS